MRWNSFTKVIRQPEQNWPAQICERPIIVGHVGNRTMALIADPEAAKTVLGGSEEQFPKWRIYERVVGSGIGHESLSVTTGSQWRRQRRAFSPMFRPEAVGQLVPLFHRATKHAIERWGTSGGVVRLDASAEMTRLSLDVIWRAAFAEDPEAQPPPIVARAAAEIHAAHLRDEVNVPPRKIAELADEVARRPQRRRVDSSNPFDAWGAESDGDSQDGLTRQELYDNARVFLGAGHETTALTLTWALWLVAQHCETQRRVHAEIDEIVGAGPIADAHIDCLTYTAQVLRETMRLFPPALVSVRQSRQAIELAGEPLPAGTVLAICIYALHRHCSWWDDPHSFSPERFAPGAGVPRHRYAYLPFSAGRHACIGAVFGWKEAVTIFAAILQRFKIATNRAVPVRPRMTITLRPDREVPIVLHPREPATS